MSSPMFGLQGGGGVGWESRRPSATSSAGMPADCDKVGRSWRTSDLRNVTQVAAVTSPCRRDGSVSHVHITQPAATPRWISRRSARFSTPRPSSLAVPYPRNDAEVELRSA